MLIDTHCHLNFQAFAKDLDDVVRRAQEAGVEKIIIPGTDLASSKQAVEIAQTYATCYAAVGIHPHHAKDPDLALNDDLRQQLKELLTQPKVVAVGEIGLDYHVYKNTKYENTHITKEYQLKQKQLLELQLELAVIHKLPVILHCRDAHDDMIQTISAFAEATADKSSLGQQISRKHSPPNNYIKPAQVLPGVWHCFGGSTPQLQLIITMGYYVGFDGNITYSSDYSALVAATPLDRLLLETDSPFLIPVPYRGKRNEPGYLPYIAQTVAKYQTTPLSEVIHLSTNNALRLFRLG